LIDGLYFLVTKADICQKKGRKDQDFKKQKMLTLNKQREMAQVKKNSSPSTKNYVQG